MVILSQMRFAFLAACVRFFASESSVHAKKELTEDSVTVREGGTSIQVSFETPGNQNVQFDNDEDCGTAAHKSVNGKKRFFDHIHISYTLPAEGLDPKGNKQKITKANMVAHWDWFYGPKYKGDGTPNHTHNCFGYCLNYTTILIQNPTFIFDDDYDATTDYKSQNRVRIDNTAHGVLITGIAPDANKIDKISQTKEKLRESPIYTRDYLCSPGGTVVDVVKRQGGQGGKDSTGTGAMFKPK